MSERSAASSADNFLDDDNDDLGMDFDDVPAQSLNEVIEELQPEPDAMDDAFDGDDDEEDSGAVVTRPISEQLARPIGELLSAIALQGISAHAKKRTLSALDDAKIVSMYRRLSSLLETQSDAKEAEAWRGDIRILEAAAAAREINLLALPEDALEPVTHALGRDAKAMAREHVEKLTGADVRAAHEPGDLAGSVFMVAVGAIAPDPAQARDEGADDELADSIKANGFYESKPIELRRHPQAGQNKWPENPNVRNDPRYTYPAYMIVDGERRYRGAVKAGMTAVPAIITDAAEDEGARLLRQVVSNEGKRLKPMEEARTYQRIMAAKGWNLQQLADHLGKSKSTVGDRVAMAEAPPAFQPLFEDGTLSAAAAPVVRKYAHLPEKVLAILVERASDDYGFREHTEKSKTVPLANVKNTLERALAYTFPEVAGGFEYGGETFTVDKKSYALDRQAYYTARQSQHRGEAHADKPSVSAKEKKAIEKARLQREATARKLERDRRLRYVQAATVAAKVPSEIDGAWALLILEELLEDRQYDLKVDDLTVFGIAAPTKKTPSGTDIGGLVRAHAEKLKGKDRVRLVLQFVAYQPEKFYGRAKDDVLVRAAALTRVDLKKVKLPPVEKDGDTPQKKSAKKGH